MNRNRSIMLQIAVGAVALGAFGYLISVCTTALARRFLLALLCIAAFGAGCTAAGSLGPNITLTGDRGPLDMLRSGPGADERPPSASKPATTWGTTSPRGATSLHRT